MSLLTAAKFQPPLPRAGTLVRTRLIDALHRQGERRLRLVAAPAGFGKTTLLADFARDSAAPVAWVALDAADRDLTDFIAALVQGLRRHAPGFGARTLTALAGASDPDRRVVALARSLAAEAEEGLGPLMVLVLDDFHEVNDSGTVTQLVAELLRLLPDNLRLVVAGRGLPNLPLSRLVVEDQLFGLGDADLRFTADELLQLLNRDGHEDLTPAQAADLAAVAEGWVAGFLLSAPRRREDRVGDVLAARGQDGLLYDYFAGEAFDRQPPEVQRFLLATAVPETVDAALCAALLGPGNWHAMRDRVEGAGLFVNRLRGKEGAFRYHQLFRAFLQTRLRGADPAEYERLHACTAAYLAAQGAWQAALAHFRAAGQDDAAAALLARVLPELEQAGRWRAVNAAAEGLPLEILGTHPEAVLAVAWAAQMAGDYPRAEALSELARATSERDRDQGLEARAVARLGMVRFMQGRAPEAREILSRAREIAPQDAELVATVRFYQGQCHGIQGDFAAAAAELHAALAYFEPHGPAKKAADAESNLAVALEASGRLAEARARYESAGERWRRLGNEDLEANALKALGAVHARLGDVAHARSALEDALARARRTGNQRIEAGALLAIAQLLLAGGEPAEARTMLRQGVEAVAESSLWWLQAELQDALALAAAFLGDLAEAEARAHQAILLAQRGNAHHQEALFSLTLGAIQSRARRPEALATLQAAADTLARMNARPEMARAQLWLSQAHHDVGATAAGRHHLRTAVRLVEDLGTDAVFDLHARWDPAPLADGVAAGIAPERLEAVLRRVRAVAPEPVAQPAGSGLPALIVRGFGPGTAEVEGRGPVAWVRDKSRELFFLLLHGGPRRQDQLTALLWPDVSAAKAQTSLYTAVYRLRRAVHPKVIVRAGGLYRVNEALVAWYDVREFERLLAEADGATDDAAIARLEQAADVCRAAFLEDLDAEWCEAERDRLERTCQAALDRLADACAAAGRLQESIAAAERLLARDPFREDTYARIVRAYLRLGDRAAAQRSLERCAAMLRDELGLTPGPELQALQERVRV